MSKNIDAEKLIKAIEGKGLDCSFALKMERLDTLALIDELQQEQTEVDLEKEIEWEWIHREKQEVDLIECAEMDKEEFARFARHFYELGLNARK